MTALAGVMIGLAYLTKRNAFFLVPPMVLWLLWMGGTLRQRAGRVAVFLAAAIVVVTPDLLWRRYSFPAYYEPVSLTQILDRMGTFFAKQGLVTGTSEAARETLTAGPAGPGGGEAPGLIERVVSWLSFGKAPGLVERIASWLSFSAGPSKINNPGHLLQYVGAVAPVLLGVYLVRRAWRRESGPLDPDRGPSDAEGVRSNKDRDTDRGDGWLWITIALYMVALLLLFTLDTEVRYAMPVASLLAVISARALGGKAHRPWVLGLVAVIAFAHLGVAASFVKDNRRISPARQAVFTYLRKDASERAQWSEKAPRVLYPGEALVVHARCQAVWSQLKNPETNGCWITGLLQEEREDKIREILQFNAVDYICVDPAQVYKDKVEVVGFGYPRSFVERLERLPFLEKVRGNWPDDQMQLWKVKTGAAEPQGIGTDRVSGLPDTDRRSE